MAKNSTKKMLKPGEYQRTDGRYVYRWTDALGKRRSLYASTLQELRVKEKQLDKERVWDVHRGDRTLEGQIQLYLQLKKSSLAPSTYNNYVYYFQHAIQDARIAKMPLHAIKKTDILRFYSALEADGFKAGSIKIVQKIIRPALQLACEDGELLRNPADGCTAAYKETLEKRYGLTHEEENEFFERIQSSPSMGKYYPMLRIAILTGLRIGELLGLSWEDVDMKNRVIDVNHQILYRKINGKMVLYASGTKTESGKRTIPMTEEVYALFMKQKKLWLPTTKNPDYEIDGYKNFVFLSNRTGQCYFANSIRKVLRRIVEMNPERDVQLPDISPHILRHTACCRWAEAGCDIKVLQKLMGHNDIRTTMMVYNHVDDKRLRREVDKMETIMKLVPDMVSGCA